jgi:acyl-CoA synthetase (AMP-forming)/AMP-acid ligase II
VRLDEILTAAARRAPDAPALVTDAGVRTFGELETRVRALGTALATVTEPGDRVAILSENRAEYVEHYYAVPAIGRVLVPLNHRLHAEEWHRTLAASGATVLVAEPDLLARLGEPGVDHVVPLSAADAPRTAPPAPDHPPGSVNLGSDSPGDSPRTLVNSVVWLVGTSGTTGSPKLAMLTHGSLLAAVDATLAARPVHEDDVLLTPFPLCHVAGYNVLVLHRRARPVVLMRRFDPVALARLVREHRVTMLSLAPTMLAMLLDHPDVDDADLATVRTLGYGASAIPAPVLERAVARWDWDLSQGYGMTELSGNAVFLGPDEHRRAAAGDERLLRAAGRPAPGVELRLSAGTDEILVRAPQVTAGYWDEPTATAATIDDAGWLRTGDVGRIDEDGLLSVVDRVKDVIVSGGENVASREVEDVLHGHPGVADVAVVGLPDERWGERVTAVVVRRDGVPVAAEELIERSRAHLAGFKAPRTVVFVDALPRNAAGKVLKQQLRDALTTADPSAPPETVD